MRRDLPIHVIMSERHITPLFGMQICHRNFNGRAIGRSSMRVQHTLNFSMQQQHIVLEAHFRHQWRTVEVWYVRHREYCERKVRKREQLSLRVGDRNADLPEQSQNASRVVRARCIVISGNHHDCGVG